MPGAFHLLVKSPGHKEYIYHEGIIKVHFDISRETDYMYSFHEMLKIYVYVSYAQETTALDNFPTSKVRLLAPPVRGNFHF